MSDIKSYFHRIVDQIGMVVPRPGTNMRCVLCVNVDVISGLPVLYYSKYTDESDTKELVGQENEQENEDDDDNQEIEIPEEESEDVPQKTPGLFDSITFGGKPSAIDSDDDEMEVSQKPIPLPKYTAVKTSNLKDETDDQPETENKAIAPEDSDYYSYEEYTDTEGSSRSNTPPPSPIKKKPVAPHHATHVPPKKHEIEVPVQQKPTKPAPPVLVPYGNDKIYRTSNGAFTKLTGEKYLSESVENLDRIAVKMFEKTFGPDYKTMSKYTDMQNRYGELYKKGL